MYIKNPSSHANWIYSIEAPDGGLLSVREKSKALAVRAALGLIASFDRETNSSFSLKGREEAAKIGLGFDEYIGLLVEQATCMEERALGKKTCWNGGLGDGIAHALEATEDSARKFFPKRFVDATIKMATAITSGQAYSTLSECSECHGKTAFSSTGNNLGRAGKLNLVTK
jgi:cytochrome c553